jgi:hypothetical protein
VMNVNISMFHNVLLFPKEKTWLMDSDVTSQKSHSIFHIKFGTGTKYILQRYNNRSNLEVVKAQREPVGLCRKADMEGNTLLHDVKERHCQTKT